MTSLYDLHVTNKRGEETTLREFQGSPLLIVNVASECGYTPQYEGLEKLHQTYQAKGLRILGFPSNDFGAQEPGTMEQIEQFCKLNYGVTFPLFAKVHAKGAEIHPLYQWLTQQDEEGAVKWNFEKFLISRDGQLIQRFRSKVEPLSEELVQAIEQAL